MKKKLKIALVPTVCLAVASLAQAQNRETGDTLQFRVGAGLERDSNVLRAPSKVSDTIASASVGARYDKQISLQRILLDIEAATFKHQDLSSLDYSTLNYNAAWNIAITPRFRGVLSADRRQYRDLTNATGGVTDSFIRSERNEVLKGTYTTGAGWLAQAGLSHRQSISENPRSLEATPSINSASVGFGRESPAGSSLIGEFRHGKGSYDNVGVGNDFTEREYALVARYPVSVRTLIEGRIGHLDREHDAAPQRDFSGTIGSLRASWEITAKTRLAGGFSRELGSYEFGTGGSVRGNRFFIEPVWKPTEKTAVRLRYQRETRDWDVPGGGTIDAGRSDRVNTASAAFEWEPRRNLLVTTALRSERRSSNVAAFDYNATILSLGARFTF